MRPCADGTGQPGLAVPCTASCQHESRVQLHFSGNSTLEGAINWVEEHAEDADIDEPLLVDKADAVRSHPCVLHSFWAIVRNIVQGHVGLACVLLPLDHACCRDLCRFRPRL